MRGPTNRRRGGFTLPELMVVLVILGILISLILIAAYDGVRRAEEKATQSLITKLDNAVADRIEALLSVTPDLAPGHQYLASIYLNGTLVPNSFTNRMQVIARFDMMKYEMPDVFAVDFTQLNASTGNYPLNFAAQPYPPSVNSGNLTYPFQAYLLPLGTLGLPGQPNRGVYGASYTAAAGIYKNLGYAPIGYDGQDNNGDGAIDDLLEGTYNATTGSYGDPTILAQITTNLHNHKHITARSEMLYALLVEGMGPFGSVLNREDFTDKEVKDTDGDGLPEFVDAWGQPIQFFRWPIHYTSDLQKGYFLYGQTASDQAPPPPSPPPSNIVGTFDPRQQDPLDPNQQLMAPGWWSGQYNVDPSGNFAGQGPLSGVAYYFQITYHSLVDMNAVYGAQTSNQSLWDRGATYYQRRAYYSRFLILSGGPDKCPGVGLLDFDYTQAGWDDQGLAANLPSPTVPVHNGNGQPIVANLILIENAAAPLAPYRNNDVFVEPVAGSAESSLTNYLRDIAGTDDITNHNVLAPGGALK
jgi:prepilin-type N-terminal cleavage/methylation domain-containing protein